MRLLLIFLSLTISILAAGCSLYQDTAYLTPVPEATLDAYRIGAPVETRLEAAIAGRKLLSGLRTAPVGAPAVVSAERTTLEEAYQRIAWNDPRYDHWPRGTSVWLVIFEGDWRLIPDDPTPTTPLPAAYHACVYSLFAAQDGKPISGGDIECPPKT